MSLASLKRRTPSANKSAKVNVEDFIAEAEHYANGGANVVHLRPDQISTGSRDLSDEERLIHSTFTLSPEAKAKLSEMTRRSGIPRSRLIRIWLHDVDIAKDLQRFCKSAVK